MDTKFLITILTTVILAFTGYFAAYINNLRILQRQERLKWVNRQLGELYGPLYALSHASFISWQKFRQSYRPESKFFFAADPPNETDLENWRLWMTTVFMPLNTRMYNLVLEKSELLIEPTLSECLLDLCAHVASYQPIIHQWENADFSEHAPLVNHPGERLLTYAREGYLQLNTEQSKLINKNKQKKSNSPIENKNTHEIKEDDFTQSDTKTENSTVPGSKYYIMLVDYETDLRYPIYEKALLGRNSNCDIFIDDDALSKNHAIIKREANKYILTDLHSVNFTFVNGKKISSQELHKGDEISLARHKLKVEIAEQVEPMDYSTRKLQLGLTQSSENL